MKTPKRPNQIVVSLEVKEAVEDEATRLTRAEKQTVTQGDVVARAMRLLRTNESSNTEKHRIPKHQMSGSTPEVPESLATMVEFLIDLYSHQQIPPMEAVKSFLMANAEMWKHAQTEKTITRGTPIRKGIK